ncbi:MAG: hypothetical protein US50_C0027G0001 [Candidatus Nomurabacteria bacterium GW2011_GWB1_37_5]|uniref:Uncharacterized protein n=1 Tax=Candidatus Nomurabacteria bacterium GW2011_GWB1_37_5 TaxID=1618742 RepID=A0A0G0GYC5_9BACT|nr:MAG: hypothetical protein US50_C0027G0001 [Candidatus Nomurabacteria bacterium GW2011_GWB1_37_5]
MNLFGAADYLNLEYFFYKILELARSLLYLQLPFGVNWADLLRTLMAIIAIILITVIIYLIIRIREVKQTSSFLHKEYFEVAEEKRENTRWQEVLKHVNGTNPPGWRLAVMESDSMLDELLIQMGYEGEGLGERLKKIDPSRFSTMDYAWEAHKVRNKIAHEGLNFNLGQYEAKRVISLYEKVFQEFGII